MRGYYLWYAGGMLTMVCLRKEYLIYLCDNFCCKIGSDNRILALLVVFGVESHTLRLNQSKKKL